MTYYDTVTHARKVLALPERATMEQIKNQYRERIRKWHPDHCREDPSRCEEKAREITEAYRVILDYCNSYIYSFERGEVEKHLSAEEWWRRRFGSDPIWGM